MGPSVFELASFLQKSFIDYSLFSESEKNELNQFLNEFEDNGSRKNETHPMPVLLSSPMDISTTYAKQNIIQISSVLIPKQQKSSNTKRQKKPYDKRPKSPHSSSSSDENENKAKHNNNSKKATHELLSEDQKRANHIASEQKRRANIRIGFEKLVDIVPTLNTGHRSEALILQKSIDHLKQLLESKTLLKERARQLQLMLGEIPDEDSSEGEMDY